MYEIKTEDVYEEFTTNKERFFVFYDDNSLIYVTSLDSS